MEINKHLENAIDDLAYDVCGGCREYKGMVSDPETGERYCVFCD